MKRLAFALAVAFAAVTAAQDPDRKTIELTGTIDGRGLPMAECDNGVHRIKLTVQVDRKGEGTGTLVLDETPNLVDDYGFPITVKAEPPVKLDCTLKLVGKKKMLSEGPPGTPAVETEWQLFEITGPKIVSKLSMARDPGAEWSHVRFLWATKEGKNRTLVMLNGPRREIVQPPPPPPCHPGCFPAGTPVQVPGGTKRIEDMRAGDVVTTVGADGKAGQVRVTAMFVTTNRLVEVNTDGKMLMTTATQPLALADGTVRAAGELKAGDRVHVWAKGGRTTAAVQSVVPTERPVPVYNVVLGTTTFFVADGFIARTKPPAPVMAP